MRWAVFVAAAVAAAAGFVTSTVSATGSLPAIAAGGYHTCAVTSGGGVKCWGHNDFGQLGDGTTTNRSTPVDVSGLSSGVQAIATPGYVGPFTCALTSGGGVKCWGYNGSGMLGDGTTIEHHTPVDVSGLSSGVVAITAGGGGDGHTCALTSGGGVKCWGFNANGELGDGTTTNRSTPVDVSGLSSGVASIAAGGTHTCAVTSGGGIKCWGRNFWGTLGDGTTTNHSTPVSVSGLSSGVVAVAGGSDHTCALLGSGGGKCWGYNGYGQLGDGSTTTRLTPVDVSGLSSGVQAVATGANQTCALVSGAVKCWGENDHGELGDGTTTNRLTLVTVSGLSSGAQAITAGGFHSCALLTGGTVKCWGLNNFGQLGDGTTTDRVTPVDVLSLQLGEPAPAFITKWGSGGSGPGQFSDPFGVAVDSADNVYVADRTNNRVQKFSSTGAFITMWGSGGSGPGQFGGVFDVALDSTGNVYVADYSNGRVQKFTSSGAFLEQWSISHPRGIAIDSSGNVYVTSESGQVQKFTSNGAFLAAWGSFAFPTGVGVDAAGNVYVADSENHRVQKFSSTGTLLATYGTSGVAGSADGQFNRPFDVAVDAGGNIYVADGFNNRIQKFNSAGVFLTKWGSFGSADGQFNTPFGVALDATGNNVYVADTNNNRVQKFGFPSAPAVDTTPPLLTLPADITAQATSAAGAAVTYAATATDNVDGAITPTCNPASGSTFAFGTTTVNCSATDAAGNTANGSFHVTVVDTFPPSLTLPAPITTEATGPAGAVVRFSVTANDAVDGVRPVTCTPASGSTFALGTTSVTCSASDTHGNTVSGSFNVMVRDTTPPVLTLPANFSVDATSPSGAVVVYSATANDAVDGAVPVSCTPASGGTFPIGMTTVACQASDASGNTSHGSFVVTVRSAAEQLSAIGAAVAGIGGGSFASQLTSVQQALAAGQKTAACGALNAFANHVRAQSGKQLTVAQANQLLAAAARIAALIGC